MPQEIERRWLIAGHPDLRLSQVFILAQIYTAIDDVASTEDRVRCRVERGQADYGFTKKQGLGLARLELKSPATREDFDRAYYQRIGVPVAKSILLYPYGQLTVEVHRFSRHLIGLAMIEIEFPDESTAVAFQPLSWFGREVTDDPRYHGRNLARFGWPRDAPAPVDSIFTRMIRV